MLNGSHYAAEEELTKYLAAVPELGPATWQGLQQPSGERGLANLPLLMLVNQTPLLLIAGYLLRAVNRFALHRSELAYQDLEAMLKQLAGAGIDNELSQWAGAMVHIHQKRYEEAAADLARLAQSPYLSDADRSEVRACSEQLRGLHQGFVLFGTQRAQLVIGRALIARAGGVQHILTQLLGAERAAQVYAPVAFLSAVSAELPKSAQDALKQGQDLSSKGLNFLKERLK
jgi:hypothetical protein